MFDWQRLEDAGLTLVPTIPPDDVIRLSSDVKALYDTDKLDTRKPSPQTLALKQLLFDIGYAVTERRLEKGERLNNEFDGATQAAVLAFQRHYFSGRRRVYKLNGCGVLDQKKPKEGTVDRTTLRVLTSARSSACGSTARPRRERREAQSHDGGWRSNGSRRAPGGRGANPLIR